MEQLHSHEVKSDVLREQLAQRVTARDAINTETYHLKKSGEIMENSKNQPRICGHCRPTLHTN